MITDPLYFHRTELAQHLMRSLEFGITHAFTLFAPRRMGKTEFLLNDIQPLAKKLGFNVFYFSFMGERNVHISTEFKNALLRFCEEKQPSTLFSKVKQIEVLGVGIERELNSQEPSLTDIINNLAKDDKPTLLLLDEVQELARIKESEGLIRALRTGLDTHKKQLKAIFTGSSTNGLRAFFNDSKAPFFHFSHSIDFPLLDKQFSDFLADIYQDRTGKTLDKDQFFEAFKRFNYTPLYLRAVAQDMIIDPHLSLEKAVNYRLSQMYEQADYSSQWKDLNLVEQLILTTVANGETGLFKKEVRQQLADQIGIETLTTSSIQTKIKKLERLELLTRDSANQLMINGSLFKQWIEENT